MNELISKATENNWKRLNTQTDTRLTARANKRKSGKKFIPFEYITHNENIQIITKIIDLANSINSKTEDVIYTIAIMLLERKNMINKMHVKKVISEYTYQFIDIFDSLEIPNNEKDLLGVVYQSLRTEGSKNISGSYYTPSHITDVLCNTFIINKNQKALDPCCGSGAFLLSISCDCPDCLYGFDIDPIAVMMAKINLLLKYSDYEFIPHVYVLDYLKSDDLFSDNRKLRTMKFDYIVTNPPWGGMQKINCLDITSGETFSYFLLKAFCQLKDNGVIGFLFPESIANIKVHSDIRHYILFKTNLCSISVIDRNFTGVLTKHLAITCKKSLKLDEGVLVFDGNHTMTIPISHFLEATDYIFSFNSNKHQVIIDKISSAGKYFLNDSDWALGIVTGNNKELLHEVPNEGEEPIYTGKEVTPYILKKAKYYIRYERNKFQQVAKDVYYRSDEKLVYKFISKRLVFSYDNQKSLLLNSANILIPCVKNMSTKTVLAFLNSYVLQFYYMKRFNVLKVLKSNLMQLPFPEITVEQNLVIEKYVNQLLSNNCSHIAPREELESEIFKLYQLTTNEAILIKEEICKSC